MLGCLIVPHLQLHRCQQKKESGLWDAVLSGDNSGEGSEALTVFEGRGLRLGSAAKGHLPAQPINHHSKALAAVNVGLFMGKWQLFPFTCKGTSGFQLRCVRGGGGQ